MNINGHDMSVGDWFWTKTPIYSMTLYHILGFSKINDKDTMDTVRLDISEAECESWRMGHLVEHFRIFPADEKKIRNGLKMIFGDSDDLRIWGGKVK
jgi:hypothetical protein